MAENEVEIILKGKFENGQLVVDTTKSINKNLDEMGKEAEKTEQKSNSLTSTLKKLAAIVGITALVNQFKNLTKSSLQAAGQMEQVNIALTTMLGSAEKAKKLTTDLIAFAKTTPFTIEGIFDTTKQLLAYGVAQEDIISTMSTLGNIAAGVGVDMGRLALAFGQVKATGKLMGQDLNQFTQAGVPLIAALADVLGKTEKEVLALKESGQISFTAVKAALEGLTAEGGRFYNLMQNQSQTFLGTISNMSDSFFQVKAALGDALLPVAKEVVQSMIAWFGSLKTIIENNRDSIAKFAQIVVQGFSIIGTAIKGAWTFLKSFIEGVKTLLSIPFLGWALAVGAAVLGLVKGFALLRAATLALTAAMAANPMGFLVVGIIGAITAIGALKNAFGSFQNLAEYVSLKAQQYFLDLKFVVFSVVESILDKLNALSGFPGFGWIDEAKKKFVDLKDSIIAESQQIQAGLAQINSSSQISGGVDIAAPGALPDMTQKVSQENLLAPPDANKEESARLKALKAENEALLEEQRNFLAGYGANQSEAERLEMENRTLRLQEKILQDEAYVARKNELDQQLLANEITNDEYKTELQALSDQAKLEALQMQYDAELIKYQENQALLNETKLEMQFTQDQAELAALQMRQQQEEALVAASEQRLLMFKVQASQKSYEQKKSDTEKSLQHQLKMDSDGYKAAQGAANELVGLQNSKNKQLAAIGKAAAIFQITNDTARGAIAAYASLAPLPIVGPALGAAAAAAIIAYGAERLASVNSNSFAVGAAEIPQDQMAQIHAGEMIIPASFSEAIRAGELSLSGGPNSQDQGGGGGGSVNIYINLDGANFTGIGEDMIAQIAQKMGEMINQDLIPAIPTRTA